MGTDTGASFDKLGVPIKYENWQLRENIAIGPRAPVFVRITSGLIAAFVADVSFVKNVLSVLANDDSSKKLINSSHSNVQLLP